MEEVLDLTRLEETCVKLYVTAADTKERTKMMNELFSLSTDLNKMTWILDHSKSPYAQHFAISTISKVMTEHWNNFGFQIRIDVRKYCS